jgi:hypothetical protein
MMSSKRFLWLSAIAVSGFLVAGCGGGSEPGSPEEALSRGKEIVREMSDLLEVTNAFTVSTNEVHERVRRSGEVDTLRFSREMTVRRPDRAWFHFQAPDRELEAWYDGDSLTLASAGRKVWAQVPMPPTLDEAMDHVALEYGVPVPMADLVYSSPYEALITESTQGGWVGVEEMGEQSCDHLAFQEEVVDWEIWVPQDGQPLPCQLRITYKQLPAQPKSTITFHDWDLDPQIDEGRFTARVPADFQRIRVVGPPTDDTAEASTPTAEEGATQN